MLIASTAINIARSLSNSGSGKTMETFESGGGGKPVVVPQQGMREEGTQQLEKAAAATASGTTSTQQHIRPKKKRLSNNQRHGTLDFAAGKAPAGQDFASGDGSSFATNGGAVMRSILRKQPKYITNSEENSEAVAAAPSAPREEDVSIESGAVPMVAREEASLGAVPAIGGRVAPSVPAAVRGGVVERQRPRRLRQRGQPSPATQQEQQISSKTRTDAPWRSSDGAKAVEGYAPSLEHGAGDIKRLENDGVAGEGEPVVFSSLADLMEAAGTLPEQSIDGRVKPGSVVETHLSFRCMDAETYKEQRALQEQMRSMGIGGEENGDESLDDVVENGVDDGSTAPSSQDSLFDLFDDDVDKENRHSNDEDEDDPIHASPRDSDEYYPEDDEDEEMQSAVEPRLFLILWKALSQWVTPEAVRHVRKLQGSGRTNGSGPGDVDCPSAPIDDYLQQPQVDRSDLGASRCAGLMVMLQMHLPMCLEQVCRCHRKTNEHSPVEDTLVGSIVQLGRQPQGRLADSTMDQISAQRRLTDLLRLWNYGRPNPAMDTRQIKALCCVLLEIVLFPADSSVARTSDDHGVSYDPAAENSSCRDEAIPQCCQSFLTAEEYRYLTRSAIVRFGTPDDNIIEDDY